MPTDIPAVDDVIEDTPLPDHSIRPPWVDEIVHAVEAIPDAIKESLPAPVPVEPAAEVIEPVVEPESHEIGSEEPEQDSTPESKPWTHKLPFSK